MCKLPDGSDWLWGKLDLALVGSDSKESTCDAGDLGSIPGEGNGYPLQLFLPGKSHGQRSLVGYSSWDRKESDTTKQLNMQHFPYALNARGILPHSPSSSSAL